MSIITELLKLTGKRVAPGTGRSTRALRQEGAEKMVRDGAPVGSRESVEPPIDDLPPDDLPSGIDGEAAPTAPAAPEAAPGAPAGPEAAPGAPAAPEAAPGAPVGPEAAPGAPPVDPVAPVPPATPEQLTQPRDARFRNEERNVNVDRLDVSQEVKDLIDNVQKGGDGFVEQRRGVVTHEETLSEAGTDALREEVRELIGKPPGTAWNAAQLTRARQMLGGYATQLKQLSERINVGNATDAEKLYFAKLHQATGQLQRALSGGIAEAGRALNAMGIMARPGAASNPAELKAALAFAGGTKDIERLAKIYSSLGTVQQVLKGSRVTWGAKIAKGAAELWINNKLSGPKTQAVNIIGNTLAQVLDASIRPITATVGRVRKAMPEGILVPGLGRTAGKSGDEPAMYSEALVDGLGKVQGLVDAMIYMWRSTPMAGSKRANTWAEYMDNLDPASKVEGQHEPVIPWKVGQAIRIPTAALSVADDFFKNMAYRGELNVLATRQAVAEGLLPDQPAFMARMNELLDNPTPEMHGEALDKSRKLTFTTPTAEQPGAFMAFATALSTLTQRQPLLKPLAPFIRTPANLIKWAVSNTPLTLLQPVEFWGAIREGGKAGDEAFGRFLMASGVAYAVMQYNESGHITGKGPRDYVMRRQLEDGGWQPNSIKMGDSYVKYDRADPIGSIIGITADAADILRYTDSEDDAAAAILSVVISVSENLTSKTYMQGMASVFDMLSDPASSMGAAKRLAASYASGMIPFDSFIRTAEQVVDPTVRDPRTDTTLGEIVNRLKMNIPGFSEDLPARIDWKGEPVVLKNGAVFRSMSPIQVSAISDGDPASVELVNYSVRVPKVDPRVTLPKSGVFIDLYSLDNGAGLEYQRYQMVVGQARRRLIGILMNSGAYKAMKVDDVAGKHEVLKGAIALGTTTGKGQYLEYYQSVAAENGWDMLAPDTVSAAKQMAKGVEPQGTLAPTRPTGSQAVPAGVLDQLPQF